MPPDLHPPRHPFSDCTTPGSPQHDAGRELRARRHSERPEHPPSLGGRAAGGTLSQGQLQ